MKVFGRAWLVTGFAALATAGHAGIAFSTLAPDDAYDELNGVGIYGSGNSINHINQWAAEQFTSGLSGDLTSIRFAVQHTSGVNSIVVRLFDDDAGGDDVGTELGSWTLADLPEDGSGAAPTDLSISDTIHLVEGHSYWLGMDVVDGTSNSAMAWAEALGDHKGNDMYSISGFHFFLPNHQRHAFEVTVADPVPEPSSLLVLALGLPALLLRRSRS